MQKQKQDQATFQDAGHNRKPRSRTRAREFYYFLAAAPDGKSKSQSLETGLFTERAATTVATQRPDFNANLESSQRQYSNEKRTPT